MSAQNNRKYFSDYRIFNLEWENDYFLVQNKSGMICLICRSNISIIKKCNAEKHYKLHLNNQITKLEGDDKKKKVETLKNQLKN
ncbi:hypothetical protein A3Q56_01021 [Intoshia linei]|uniref:Uncharacterized protein n=1 Tax=Intoshia linei TaxID=1819745 RepID=A0A177BA28_9BILA|nr:hypothetical protein A3Q56_01021 [Intoshia linei]